MNQMTSLELRCKALPEGQLVLSLERVEIDDPDPGEVVVRNKYLLTPSLRPDLSSYGIAILNASS